MSKPTNSFRIVAGQKRCVLGVVLHPKDYARVKRLARATKESMASIARKAVMREVAKLEADGAQ